MDVKLKQELERSLFEIFKNSEIYELFDLKILDDSIVFVIMDKKTKDIKRMEFPLANLNSVIEYMSEYMGVDFIEEAKKEVI